MEKYGEKKIKIRTNIRKGKKNNLAF